MSDTSVRILFFEALIPSFPDFAHARFDVQAGDGDRFRNVQLIQDQTGFRLKGFEATQELKARVLNVALAELSKQPSA